MKALQQYFRIEMFVVLHMMVPTMSLGLKSLSIVCDHSREGLGAVLSIGSAHYTV